MLILVDSVMRYKQFISSLTVAVVLFLATAGRSVAQDQPDSLWQNIPPPELGPNDTIPVPATAYDGQWVPAQVMPWAWVNAPLSRTARRQHEEWTRLRNAIYVTYPYARKAGVIINDINRKLAGMTNEATRKKYLLSREKELKKEFTQPLEQLSIYQGRVLMKLINRQTGNNCYNIIREYRGGFTARFWQTVAFFFNSSLKQPYDPGGDDRQMESIVQEVERIYGVRS